MAFKGITFSGQNVTPKNDGGLYQAHNGDGILWGCSMAISGDDLVIQSGEFIAGGRVCFVDGATNVDLSGRVNNTGYIQVIMNYDMTQGEGSQWYTSFVESATTTFPALTQDDINDTGTLYQLQLAIVQVSGGNLTSIYSSVSSSTIRYYPKEGGFTQIGGQEAYRSIQNFDLNGDPISGITFNVGSKRTELWVDGGDIYFRPQGQNSGSNTVYVSSSGFIGGTNFRRHTFTGGEVLQAGNICVLNYWGSISSTAAANTWYTLVTPTIPTPIATTYGNAWLGLAAGNVGAAQVQARINTSRNLQYSASSTTGSWSIGIQIVYWTSTSN